MSTSRRLVDQQRSTSQPNLNGTPTAYTEGRNYSSGPLPEPLLSVALVGAVVLVSTVVLVDHSVSPPTRYEPAVGRIRRHSRHTQRKPQAPPQKKTPKPRLHSPGYE